MLKKYSCWHAKDGSQTSFHPGEELHPWDSIEDFDLAYIIQAETFEEAVAVHYLRMGWSPYKPMGQPIECPNCKNYFYLGSGECFCGYKQGD